MTFRIAAALVFASALALYLPGLKNGFAYDDHHVIRLDPRVQDLSQSHRLLTEPYWRDAELGLYRPLASLSYALDWALGDGSPSWFHFMNAVWNAAACLLVLAVLHMLVPLGPAVLGALLFAVHPVHVEAVANVVGRAEVMAALFSMAALLLWLRAPPYQPLGRRAAAGVVAFYALALLSKENAIMLPALLALIDMARGTLRPQSVMPWLRRHARTLTLLAGTAVLYLIVRTVVVGGVSPGRLDPALEVSTGPATRILTALQAWPFIVRLLLYPRTLLSDYGPRVIMPAFTLTPLALAGVLIPGTLVIGGLLAWSRGYGRAACALLFLPVALLPVSNLVVPIGVVVAERALYLPSFALAAGAAFGAAAVWGNRRARPPLSAVAAVIIMLFTARSLIRIPEWRSTGTVFEALRRDRPDAFRGQWHHAQVAVGRGDAALALERYARAVNTWPFRRTLVVEAANYAGSVGDLEFARTLADHALGHWPDDVTMLRLRAGVALDLGDTVTARTVLRSALRLAPRDSILLRMQAAAGSGTSP